LNCVARGASQRVPAAGWLLGLVLLALTGWVQPLCAQDKQLKRWSGEATPELKLKDVEGRLHDLGEYRGKVVLVNFWATWCEPCRDELPSMMRLRQRFAGRPFEVLAVDAGEGEARVKEFLQKMPLSFPVLLDTDSAAMRDWKVRGLPASFVVDATGQIRYSFLGELDWMDARTSGEIGALFADAAQRSRK